MGTSTDFLFMDDGRGESVEADGVDVNILGPNTPLFFDAVGELDENKPADNRWRNGGFV